MLSLEIMGFFQDNINLYGAGHITVLSSLAEGADSLCAKAALEAGLRLVAPLPMHALEYRTDFTGTAATGFDCLLSLADQVFVVSPSEAAPENPVRAFCYRQAGVYIVNNCDVLLALWDGVEKDSPDGAGTWETIKYAREVNKPVQVISVR